MSFETLKRHGAEMAVSNPANAPEKGPRKRTPLGVPTLKLTVPEIPGYVCHWFRGTPQRLQQAIAAGYQFVEADEVHVQEVGFANDRNGNGNSDLGTRVSVLAGGDDMNGQASRLYLMKIRKELWDEDQLEIDKRHEAIAATIRGDKSFTQAGQDSSNRYSRGENRNIFQPRRS